MMDELDPDMKELVSNIVGRIEKFEITEEGNFDIVLKKPVRASKKDEKE